MKMDHALVVAAESARQRLSDQLFHLAENRLGQMLYTFARRYPNHEFHAIFGMGTYTFWITSRRRNREIRLHLHESQAYGQYLTIVSEGIEETRRRRRSLYGSTLGFIFDALQDVENITGNFEDACPRDINYREKP